MQWSYLNGDGDFLSDEVKQLRNEADIIVTNLDINLSDMPYFFTHYVGGYDIIEEKTIEKCVSAGGYL